MNIERNTHRRFAQKPEVIHRKTIPGPGRSLSQREEWKGRISAAHREEALRDGVEEPFPERRSPLDHHASEIW